MSGGRPAVGAWRLWSLQGSWNRQGLQWLGWIVVWAPWLRERIPDASSRARWLAREPAASNTNPYVAGLLLGARMRVEEQHGPAPARRLALALSRTLGALGDAWIWTGIRPVFALAVLLLLPWLGVGAALAGWMVFAVGQAALRRWCLLRGYELGEDVVGVLESPRVQRGLRSVRVTGAALAGAVTVLVISGHAQGGFTGPSAVAGLVAAGLGSVASWRRWQPEWVLLGSVFVLALVARTWIEVTGGSWTWP